MRLDLERLERILDETNSDYGSKEEYCIYCKSKEYNSQVGIVHFDNCIVLELRDKIKEEKELEEIFEQVWRNKYGNQSYE